MFSETPKNGPQQLHSLLISGFSLFGLTAMLAPLRHANRMSGKTLYSWLLISELGGEVNSSDGIEVQCHEKIQKVVVSENIAQSIT